MAVLRRLAMARPGTRRQGRSRSMALQLDGTLLLAGAGNMGYALLAGWLEGGLDPNRIVVQEPAPQPRVAEELRSRGIAVHAEVAGLPEPPAVVLVAVK